MYRLMRWYNQNREEIIVTVIIIALVIIIIQVLNAIAARQNELARQEYANIANTIDNTATSNRDKESVITGEKVPEEEGKKYRDIIKTFVDYCNDNELEKAYNMLSDECKENLYPSLQGFKTNYYDRIFDSYKMYNLENWYNYQDWCTYYIRYIDDILATGNAVSDDIKGDYITIVKGQTDYKINISGYIGRKTIGSRQTNENIEVTIIWEDMYMDYSVFNININNNRENSICIDTKKALYTTCLYDSNSVKYLSYLNEIADEQLIVYRNMVRNLNVKFDKNYNPERKIEGLKMTDIVLNYDNYKNGLEEKTTITIDTKM